MPNDDTITYILSITNWIEYYEKVQERCAEYDTTCPQEVKDDPTSFYKWIKHQQQIEKTKLNSRR